MCHNYKGWGNLVFSLYLDTPYPLTTSGDRNLGPRIIFHGPQFSAGERLNIVSTKNNFYLFLQVTLQVHHGHNQQWQYFL